MPKIVELEQSSEETWREIRRWGGIYEVSDLGRVRRVKPNHGTRSGYILKALNSFNGYARVQLRDADRWPSRQAVAIHRLVVEAFVRPLEDHEEPNHKNFDRADNRLSNLEILTHGGNAKHAIAGGRGNCKLDWDAVRKIRGIYRKGSAPCQSELAAMFGVSLNALGDILRGRTWQES